MSEENLGAAKIAAALGVSDAKVKKVIKELGIEPASKRGACCFYDAAAQEKIKAALA